MYSVQCISYITPVRDEHVHVHVSCMGKLWVKIYVTKGRKANVILIHVIMDSHILKHEHYLIKNCGWFYSNISIGMNRRQLTVSSAKGPAFVPWSFKIAFCGSKCMAI